MARLNIFISRFISGGLGGLLLVSSALAAGPRIVTRISADPPGKTAPGQTLTYTVAVQNNGDAMAQSVRVVDPLPSGVEYIPGSANSPLGRTELSIDGGKTWSDSPTQVSSDGGKIWRSATPVENGHLSPRNKEALSRNSVLSLGDGRLFRSAPAVAITHVRWQATQGLAPGASVSFHLKVRVR